MREQNKERQISVYREFCEDCGTFFWDEQHRVEGQRSFQSIDVFIKAESWHEKVRSCLFRSRD